MKPFFFLLLVLPFLGYSQTDSSFIFSRVVTLKGISQDKIFLIAKEWFSNQHLSDNNKFILESETGKVTGVGNIDAVIKGGMGAKDKGLITFYFKLLVKDEKCKLELSHFTHSLIMANGGDLADDKPDCGYFSLSKKSWIEIKDLATTHADYLLNDFERRMTMLITKQEDF